MKPLPYDASVDPPAPVIPLRVRIPGSAGWLQLAGLVDTGVDLTLLPREIAERHLPLAGRVEIRGATGDTSAAALYLAEIEIARLRRATLVAGLGEETIVGRDLLALLRLTLDGPARLLTATAPHPR